MNNRVLRSAIYALVPSFVLIALGAAVLNVRAKVIAAHGATGGYWPQTFKVSGAMVTAVLFFAAIIFLYLLPTILGWRKQNRAGILGLNLFAGWTVAGWIVALVWATTKERRD